MDEADEELACKEKIAFDTKEMAEGAAAAAEWQHGNNLKAYKCKHCGLWHLAGNYKS